MVVFTGAISHARIRLPKNDNGHCGFAEEIDGAAGERVRSRVLVYRVLLSRLGDRLTGPKSLFMFLTSRRQRGGAPEGAHGSLEVEVFTIV